MAKAKAKAAGGKKSNTKKAPPTKDPEGGLTAAGRAAFKKKEGANLKPGVTKALKDMTPEEIKRKGSFLRRHFATLRGPLVDDDGQPTRLALQAHAWGEPVPKTPEAAKKLADKGSSLLDRYRKSQEKEAGGAKARPTTKKAPKAGAPKAAKSDAKAKQPGQKPAPRSPRSRPKAKAKPSDASGGSPYTDPALRDRLKAEIMDGDKGGKSGQWSARKLQLLAAEYKKAGGGYTKGKGRKTEDQSHLDDWTEEKWTTQDGQPAVRDGETARYLPQAAWEAMSPAERKATDRKKKEGSRQDDQFVPNTKAAKSARKSAKK
ncbi:DUF6321 domain-containing protein [Tundrisphaera sp. TA3]|uniref:DUF6321 domain-containing protein n=1 Tax=Tundrisphaera sp. TA3 TaxID=3435775 RepID=UPI003EBFC930